MVKIKVKPVKLERRKKMLFNGGQEQSKARALFVFLTPRDGNMYTASQVVKHSFPFEDYPDEYRRHYRTLAQLAISNNVAPDDVKRRARYAETWYLALSDEVWGWGCDFMDDLLRREAVASEGNVIEFYVDLDTFEVFEDVIQVKTIETSIISESVPEIENHEGVHVKIGRLIVPLMVVFCFLYSWLLKKSDPEPVPIDLNKDLLEFELNYLSYEISDIPNRPVGAYSGPTVDTLIDSREHSLDIQPQYMVMLFQTLHEH